MSLAPLAEVIAAYGLAPKKNLGQHFLLDAGLLARIVAQAGDLSGIHIVEIGPGPGGLTRALLESRAASVTVIEKDRRFIPALLELKNHYGDRLHILQADALRADLVALVPAPRAVIANLPYNIGTELVADWLEQLARLGTDSFQQITVMLQEEVAARFCATPGSKIYGRLSVLAQWLTEPVIMLQIPPAAFVPPPKVMSAVIRLNPRSTPLAEARLQPLTRIVAAAFNQRRKMLRRSLTGIGVEAETLLTQAGIDATRRPETLSVAEFCALARTYEAMAKL
ncbi:MAG: 16S rRNA (adenine(1518)-N(6)/adenine(1519)-N(6))-dimethyltransferase RsmA [Rickettsiales bacterium]|nr:16S rRNA (adenine(1518)-N(6)/adenine(1519)-N(6))-dimethyltransferase RsmA [Rickettsiales bacterium]